MKGIKMDNLTKLRYWTFKILPLVYDDSLSYYEVLTKVTAKINELVDSNNAMPQAITDEVKKQLNSDELATKIFEQLANAIATNEGNSTFTANTKSGGELIWLNGTLYKVVAVMPAGTNYITGTNIIPVDISKELRNIKEKYLSNNNEHWNERSTNSYNTGTYLFWRDVLYVTTKDIKANDILYSNGDNQNLKEVTITEEITNHYNELHKILPLPYITPEQFGAIGDGVTDDTVAIQRAIDSLTNGGTVYFHPKHYLTSDLYIKTDGITLQGSRGTDATHSTMLIPSKLNKALISIGTENGHKVIGGQIKDIHIGNSRQSYNIAVNGIGLFIQNTAEFNLNSVMISGFTYGGIYAIDWWDSTIISTEIRACGDTNNAAMALGGSADSSNGLHFFGLHIEECPYLLNLGMKSGLMPQSLVQSSQFIGCKFEDGASNEKYFNRNNSAITVFEGCEEITFTACFFSLGSFNIGLNIRNNGMVLTGCTFAHTSNIIIEHTSRNQDYGKFSSFIGNTFSNMQGNNPNIILGKYDTFIGNYIRAEHDNIINADNNTIINNNIIYGKYTVMGTGNGIYYEHNSAEGKFISNTTTAYQGNTNINAVAIRTAEDIVIDADKKIPLFILNEPPTSITVNNPYEGAQIHFISNTHVDIDIPLPIIQNATATLKSGHRMTLTFITELNKWAVN